MIPDEEEARVQEAILALLAKEPAHGYELRQRVEAALGPAGGALNPGHVYVTLSRLERSGLVRGPSPRPAGLSAREISTSTS